MRAAAYLLPQAVVAIPLGLVAAALFNAQRHRPAARQTLCALIGLACVATVVLLWLLPASNQAFRILMASRPAAPPPRPARNWTLRTLASDVSGRRGAAGGVVTAGPGLFTRESRCCSDRWRSEHSPSRWSRPLTKTMAALLIGGYLGFFIWPAPVAMGELGIPPPALAPWVPNLLALAAARVLRASSVNRAAA